MFIEPDKGVSGFFDVDWGKNFPNWFAWREWQHEAFGKTFFPQHLTVMFAWPPTSGLGANAVGSWLGELRRSIEEEGSKRPTGKGGWKPIPDFVPPWRQWDGSYKRDLIEAESFRRQAWGPNWANAPAYHWHHVMGSRFEPPMPITPKPARQFQQAAE